MGKISSREGSLIQAFYIWFEKAQKDAEDERKNADALAKMAQSKKGGK